MKFKEVTTGAIIEESNKDMISIYASSERYEEVKPVKKAKKTEK